ncbi:NPC intracellular cholesterol transporter 2-like [Mya arenaria]|uniref:NPC intracellular cholesterol transporter 2-like n=1 Tax=Mya arenaria TaxID=6604 RepID=UPI0022E07403|nr:NPC intracellular cholesterol transporter 2-like [Mya arenaria]
MPDILGALDGTHLASSHGTVHSIYLGPCEHEPCQITAGQTYNATINFTANENTPTATNECQGEIAGAWVDFPVKPINACGYGVTCPIVKGETYTYTASVTCPADVNSMRMVGKWMVKDDMNRDIICFAFPLVIKGN